MEKRRPSALQEFFQQSQQGNFSPSTFQKNRSQKQNKKPVLRQILQSIILFTLLVMTFQLGVALMFSITHGSSNIGFFSFGSKSPKNKSPINQKIAQDIVEQSSQNPNEDQPNSKYGIEIQVLMSFKQSVQNSGALESWSGENPCDGWKGITCQNEQITELLLKQEQLYTKIPFEFSKLSNLEKLELSSSGMQGVVPVELSVLNLSELYLHLNAMEGNLMPQFSTWQNLNSFHIEYNKFSGSLPEEYSTWNNIQNLDMTSNAINGEIPRSYSEWKKISRAQFSYNLLGGQIPSEFSEWKDCQVMYFSGQKNDDQLCIPEGLKQSFLDQLEENRHDLSELATCQEGEKMQQEIQQEQQVDETVQQDKNEEQNQESNQEQQQ